MSENTLPNTKLEVMKEIDREHLIKVESVITKGFRERILQVHQQLHPNFQEERT